LSITKAGHRENYPIKGRAARTWLVGLFYASERRGLSGQECADALGLLEAQAIHEGPEHLVAVRVAHQEGRVLLDLGRPEWDAVEVTPDGWMVRPALDLPVRFKRPAGLLALPMPRLGGDLRKLVELLNTSTEGIILILAWLLFALGGAGPYPILALSGEQGTGKSTFARMLREIVDPNSVGLRTTPKEERDLAIAAQNAHVIGFDNFSSIPEWLSDALCRLATGAGFATRALYTDSEETLFSAKRPIILNGIPDLMTRGDLADRALAVTLEQIKEEDRKPETEIWRKVEAVKPEILGGLLDAVAVALRNLPNLNLGHLPRMADFARFIVAAEPAMPWKAGEFLETYKEAREDGARILLEGDTIHALVVGIAIAGNPKPKDALTTWEATPNQWTGTAGDLLVRLNAARAGDKPKGWPNSARALSGHLRRIAPAMRQTGLEVEYARGGGKGNARIITLRFTDPKDRKQPSEQSEPSETHTAQGVSCRTQNNGNRPTNAPDRPTEGAVPDVRTQTGPVGRKPISTVRQENPFDIRHTDGSDGSDGVFPSLGAASGSEYTVDL
jgi:energy-coupling factor transporter ATP-binding protein EcfA2